MSISWKTKTFDELSTQELYQILRLRSEVFVVEQNCVYQDIDNKDQKALHLFGIVEGEIIAYSRLFKPGDYFKEASIGRVVVAEKERHLKYGNELMNASIKAIESSFQVNKIKLSAQKYLENFYSNLGFKTIGEPYLEDGIPHIAMVKN